MKNLFYFTECLHKFEIRKEVKTLSKEDAESLLKEIEIELEAKKAEKSTTDNIKSIFLTNYIYDLEKLKELVEEQLKEIKKMKEFIFKWWGCFWVNFDRFADYLDRMTLKDFFKFLGKVVLYTASAMGWLFVFFVMWILL